MTSIGADAESKNNSRCEADERCLDYLNLIHDDPGMVLLEPPLIEGFTHLMIAAATCDHATTKDVLELLPDEVNPADWPHH
jgi:hypothetical protein